MALNDGFSLIMRPTETRRGSENHPNFLHFLQILTDIPDGAGPMGPTTPKVLEGYTYCELHLKLKRKAQPAVL